MTSVLIEMQPGKESGRHIHPVPTYVHVLEGTLTVEFEDGSRQAFKAGSGFLEVVNTWHNGKNLGEVPLRFLVVFAGEEGNPNLIRPEKHKTSAPTN
jgi:quercetin dioxygenase-like cupin family protein